MELKLWRTGRFTWVDIRLGRFCASIGIRPLAVPVFYRLPRN